MNLDPPAPARARAELANAVASYRLHPPRGSITSALLAAAAALLLLLVLLLTGWLLALVAVLLGAPTAVGDVFTVAALVVWAATVVVTLATAARAGTVQEWTPGRPDDQPDPLEQWPTATDAAAEWPTVPRQR